MVTSIDLKPLTPELIEQMGYNNHDLWLVKIDSTIFGPYETESLKHYVHDNEALFETAEASRADETEWKPFWAHTKFQRRKPQAMGQMHEGPFWILQSGLKAGPYSYKEIDKKLEMDLLGMTDHISTDNGDTWIKIYEVSGFDRRSHSPDELPIAPPEISFQKSRLQVVDKLETPHLNASEELAELAWQGQKLGKVIEFKAEEITIKPVRQTEVSHSMKWAMPAAGIALVAILSSGYMVMTSESDNTVAMDETSQEDQPFYKKLGPPPAAVVPSPSMRSPASVGYSDPDPVTKYESRYPTHMETHEQYQEPVEQPYNDPVEVPMSDADQQPQEHSLVTNNHAVEGTAEDHSLDAAMNGTVPDQPVIEEASDF